LGIQTDHSKINRRGAKRTRRIDTDEIEYFSDFKANGDEYTTPSIEENTDTPQPSLAFWKDSRDDFVLACESLCLNGTAAFERLPEDDRKKKKIKFKVRGNPLSLRRHRTGRGFVYNPSAAKQHLFRDVVKSILPSVFVPGDQEINQENRDEFSTPLLSPLFPAEECIAVTLVFHLKRPKNHFVSNKPGHGRLRPSSKGKLPRGTRNDVDNLAKFVLDSLNGLLYADDRQVVSLSATKVFDVEGNCDGATEIFMESIHEKDIDSYLASLFYKE